MAEVGVPLGVCHGPRCASHAAAELLTVVHSPVGKVMCGQSFEEVSAQPCLPTPSPGPQAP